MKEEGTEMDWYLSKIRQKKKKKQQKEEKET